MYRTYFASKIKKVPPGKYSLKELNVLYFPKITTQSLYKSLNRMGIMAEKEIFRGHLLYFYTIK